jgi:TfoX/Sxy family transcriptional regulator of competence genes
MILPVCSIQVRKSFFAELGIYNNETFIQQVYYDFILGKANQSYEKENYQVNGIINTALIDSAT